MKHKITYVALGVFLCLLSGAIFLGYGKGEVPAQVEAAKRSFVLDGELYTVDNLGKTQKLTDLKDIKYLFGESNDALLFGKNFTAQNSHSSGMNLYVMKKDNNEARKITEELVEFALLDTAKTSVIFLTPEGKIKKQRLDGGNSVEIADLASAPSISPDDERIAFKKMPKDWTPGGYSDGSPGIVVREIKTGKERVVADQEADHAAFWTPDGRFIYFFGDNGFGFDSLFIINSDGSERTLLTNAELSEYNPETAVPSISEPPIISRDGRMFVYESDKEIWLVETSVEEKKLVDARRIGYGINPQWEKDGETISVVTGGKGKASLITLDISGNVIAQ